MHTVSHHRASGTALGLLVCCCRQRRPGGTEGEVVPHRHTQHRETPQGNHLQPPQQTNRSRTRHPSQATPAVPTHLTTRGLFFYCYRRLAFTFIGNLQECAETGSWAGLDVGWRLLVGVHGCCHMVTSASPLGSVLQLRWRAGRLSAPTSGPCPPWWQRCSGCRSRRHARHRSGRAPGDTAVRAQQ